MHRLRRFWWIACAGLAAVGCQPSQPAGGQQSGPPAVSVSKPVQRQVMNYEDLTGQTEAVEMVDVRARVTGYLNSVEFVDGSEVREGDLLFQIDARPYQDQLDQAVAQVKANQESYRLAQTIYASDNSAGSAVPRQQVAQDYASMLEADARTKASIASTEVNKLNMEFTRVTAPISGQISRTYVTRGNLITQDSTPLTTIVKPDPMYAYFELDEPTLLRIRRDIIEGRSPVPGQGMTPVYFGLQGEDGWPHQGVVDFFNNQINPATGTISVRGVFANPLPSGDLPRLGGTLLGMGDSAFGSGPLQVLAVPASRRLRAGFRLMSPGMFVRIHLPVGQPHDALLVTDRAISSDQGLKYIYVVDSNNKLRYLRVATGALQDDGLREVLKAPDTNDQLKPDDSVVVGSLQQLGRGMEVKPSVGPMPTLGPGPSPGASDDQGAADGKDKQGAATKGGEKQGAATKGGKSGRAAMISRFFIDRPVFATVLSVLITLIGFIALLYLPIAQYPRITPPGVVVSISYPGATAQVVADTVAAPIEQAVNGVEGMLYMSSQMGNDGTYSLNVTFDVGVDLKTALVMVQNRVTQAMPQLPSSVQNQGITIRKKTPDILMIVNFFSPDNRYDDVYLSNYATINIKDELLRVPGVSDITYQGERDYSIRIWLDPQKLASCRMNAVDVANALKSQNIDAPAGQVGQPPAPSRQRFQLPLDTLGRLTEPEQFEDIIVKVGPRGSGLRSSSSPGAPSGGITTGGASSTGVAASGSSASGSSTDGSSTTPAGVTTGGTSPSTTTTPSPSSTTTPATTTNNSTTGGATSSGGATAIGGGTTNGGAMSSGGATGQSSTPGVSTVADQSTTGSATLTSTTTGRGPGLPAPAIVRVRDVGRVELGALNYTQSCTFNGQPSVGLGVYQLPGTNALDVANAVRKKMKELKSRFPDGLDYKIAYDTTPFIRESVLDVIKTLLEAVGLVGLVVLFFLQDWRAMILPLIDVPVSIIGTFVVMGALGFSLNNISLFGLVLAIGIVVDDAIVVLENIERMMARGYDPRTAAIKAMDEVTGPIVAVALVLCAVFVPCAFIGGITGLFFHQFAITVAVSTVISAVNAVTMTPSRAVLIFKTEHATPGQAHQPRREALPWWFFGAVGAVLTLWLAEAFLAGTHGLPPRDDFLAHLFGLKSDPNAIDVDTPALTYWGTLAAYAVPGLIAGLIVGWVVIRPVNFFLGWCFRLFNRVFDAMTAAYAWVVGHALRLSAVVLLGYVGLVGLTVWMFSQAPTGFIPQQDQGRLIVNIQLPDAYPLERTKAAVAKIEKIAHDTPGVSDTVAMCGSSFLLQANSSNYASMFIVLKPFDERQTPDLRDMAIKEKLDKAWKEQVKEAVVTAFPASPVPGLGSAGGFKIIVEDRGGVGLANLQMYTNELVRRMKKEAPGLTTVSTQFRSDTPQIYADIDRSKVAALGLSLNDVNQTLDIYLGSLYVNSYNQFGRHWQVTVQAEGDQRSRIDDINRLEVRNNQGQMVPLGTLLTPTLVGGPLSVPRYNLYTSAAITGNIKGVSTGDAIKAIDQLAAQTLPTTMSTEWTEIMFVQIQAGNTAFYIFLLAILAVFLALSALYESWALPLAVILVVPLCLLCSVAGVVWSGRDVNIFVQIGLVVLVGLACKNAILVVEYARQLHREGKSVYEATKEASRLRLRPILMTSFAFIFGVVPLVIASGAGAEMRRSLGVAVFSGMLGVTLFGIFLTPVYFYVIQGFSEIRLFEGVAVRRAVSGAVGALLGAAIGFLLAKVRGNWAPWAPVFAAVGAVAGLVLLVGSFEMRRLIRDASGPKSNGKKDAAAPVVDVNELTGGPKS